MRIRCASPNKDVLLQLITPDLQPKDQGMINLADSGYQESLRPYVERADLIVVDNISTLVNGGKENESDSWHAAQLWALRQRAAGRSVLWIHHSGKNGTQRGTSRREDVLDTTIGLRRPSDYTPDQGAVFEIHFEKSRGFKGDEARPLEAGMQIDENEMQTWSYRNLEESTYDRCCDLANDGLKNYEIADELGINKSTVSRHVKQGKQRGDIRI